MIIPPGSTSQILEIQIVDDSGLPVLGLVAGTFPATSYVRTAAAPISITLIDLSLINSAFSAGGVKEIGGGYYRLDVPDAAWTSASQVRIIGEVTGKHILYPVVLCAYVQSDVEQWKGAAAPANTGDAFAESVLIYNRLGAPAGASVSADVAAALTAINNINNLSALAVLISPNTLVRPSAGSIAYPFVFLVKDAEGHLLDVDTNTVTLAVVNAAGTDRSGNLSGVTHVGTGQYGFTYTVSSAHVDEGLRFSASGTVQTATRLAYANAEVQDANSLAALAAIQAQTDKFLFDGSNNVKSAPQTQVDLVNAPNATAITAIQAGLATATNLTTLINRIGAFTGSGVNTVFGFFRALMSKTATLPSDVGGTFDVTEDSNEAIRDHGDSAWITGGGGSAPTAQSILDLFKADADWLAMVAGVVGEFDFDDSNPGVMTLYEKGHYQDPSFLLATITVTRNSNGVVTRRRVV